MSVETSGALESGGGVLPFSALAGSPYEQGLAHGRAVPERVHHNVRVYRRRFTLEAGLEPEQVHERARAYWALIEAEAPDYADGVRGIADGADAELLDVIAVNVRYEILYSRLTELLMTGVKTGVSECTAFAVETRHRLVMGQNWDWIPDVQGLVVRMDGARGESVGEPDLLAFTEAGIFGPKIGLNSAGIGLAVNGLASTGDDWRRMGTPFHVRTWRALRADTLEGAVAALRDGEHACSANFVVGQAGGGAIDLETAPEGSCTWPTEGGRLVHTNHFLSPETMGLTEPENPRRVYSVNRRDRLAGLIEEEPDASAERMKQHLRDHDGYPNSVCRHPDLEDSTGRPPYQTVTSAVMELETRTLWLTDGPPCGSEYQHFAL